MALTSVLSVSSPTPKKASLQNALHDSQELFTVTTDKNLFTLPNDKTPAINPLKAGPNLRKIYVGTFSPSEIDFMHFSL